MHLARPYANRAMLFGEFRCGKLRGIAIAAVPREYDLVTASQLLG